LAKVVILIPSLDCQSRLQFNISCKTCRGGDDPPTYHLVASLSGG